MFVITKNADEDTLYEIKEELKEIFEDFDDEKQMKDLGNVFSDNWVRYKSDCRKILERLRDGIEAHTNFYKRELNDLKAKMLSSKTLSTHEYEHIYGTYWLLTDSMQAMSKGNECQVLTLDEDFRANHMKVKNFLFNRTSLEQLEELSRSKMFPLYT